MSNIDINLIRARDGAAPQHKVSNANKFELTEGSDGAQHVKIVDSEGNVQDKIPVELPDKQIVTVDNQIQLPTDYPDKAVEARLQAIESKQQAILDKLESGLDTRLTGSIVEEEVIFDRQILTENSGSSRLFRPNNAKGFIVYLYIYGITGNFSTNDGVRLRIRNYGYTIGRHFSSYSTRVTTTGNRLHVALMYPGVEESSAMGLTSGASYIAVNSVATNNLRVEVEVDGTFDVGEGVDCEVGIEWIL